MKRTITSRRKQWFFARAMVRAYREMLEKTRKDRSGTKKAKAATQRPLFAEALEPRVLFSGTPAPVEEVNDADQTSDAVQTAELLDGVVTTDATADGIPDAGFTGDLDLGDLEEAEVERLAKEAVARWEASGLTEEQAAALEEIEYVIDDLGGNTLGYVDGMTVYLDDDAAGLDWFIDATEGLDEEFVAIDGLLQAESGEDAGDGVDLLSVIMHEQGHIVGLLDDNDSDGDIMDGLFDEGERRVIAEDRAEGAVAGSLEGVHYATANIVEDFEGLPTGSTALPTGWSYVNNGGSNAYVTVAGDGGGVAAQITGDNTTNANQPPGSYIVNDGSQPLDVTSSITGSFDYYTTGSLGRAQGGVFMFGDILTGISGASDGTYLGMQMMSDSFGNRGGVIDGSGTQVANFSGNQRHEQWYTINFTWTPTSGTTGNFSATGTSNSTTSSWSVSYNNYTFDSNEAYFGFGAGDYFNNLNTAIYDNISITGTVVSSGPTTLIDEGFEDPDFGGQARFDNTSNPNHPGDDFAGWTASRENATWVRIGGSGDGRPGDSSNQLIQFEWTDAELSKTISAPTWDSGDAFTLAVDVSPQQWNGTQDRYFAPRLEQGGSTIWTPSGQGTLINKYDSGTGAVWQTLEYVVPTSGFTSGTDLTLVLDSNGFRGFHLDNVSLTVGEAPIDNDAPTPDPLTWAVEPTTSFSDFGAITMTATTASDAFGVQYNFENITNGTSSGWQSSPTWTETGLADGTSYTYRAQARDGAPTPNVGGYTSSVSATTLDALPDGVLVDSGGFQNPTYGNGTANPSFAGWTYNNSGSVKARNSDNQSDVPDDTYDGGGGNPANQLIQLEWTNAEANYDFRAGSWEAGDEFTLTLNASPQSWGGQNQRFIEPSIRDGGNVLWSASEELPLYSNFGRSAWTADRTFEWTFSGQELINGGATEGESLTLKLDHSGQRGIYIDNVLLTAEIPFQAEDDDYTTSNPIDEDTVLNIPADGVFANDSGVDSLISFDGTSTSGASVTVNGDGSFSYDPTSSAAAQALNVGDELIDTFTYTITDGVSVGTGPLDWNFSNDLLNGWTVLNGRETYAGNGISAGTSTGGNAHDAAHETFLVESPTFQFDGTTVDGTNALVLDFEGGQGSQGGSVGAFANPGEVVGFNGGNSASNGLKAVGLFNTATGQYDATYFDPGNGGGVQQVSVAAGAVSTGVNYRLHFYDNDDGSWGWTRLNRAQVGGGAVVAGATDTATVSVKVDGVNDEPEATGDEGAVLEGADAIVNATDSGNVLGNDTDVDNTAAELSVSEVNGSSGNVGSSVTGTYGSVVINSDGSFTYTLDDTDPDTDGLGHLEVVTETFTYTVEDAGGATDTATLTVTITGANDSPTASANDYAVNEDDGSAVLGNIITDDTGDGADSDPENSSMSVTSVDTSGTRGTVSVDADGSFTYDPNGQFESLANGETVTDTFTYTVSDGSGPATLVAGSNVLVSENNANFNISVFDGKAGYDNSGTGAYTNPPLVTNAFGDGTVEDYNFVVSRNGMTDPLSYADGGAGLTPNPFDPNPGTGGFSNNSGQNWANVWTTSDPGTNFNTSKDFTSGSINTTHAGHGEIQGTVDISGFTDGTLYFPHGTFVNNWTINVVMSGAGQPDVVETMTQGGNGPGRNLGWITDFNFSNAGLYDTITYTYTHGDLDGSRARFMGVILDGSAPKTDTATVTVTITGQNDAPVLGAGVADFSDVGVSQLDSNGDLISDLVNGQISDVDDSSVEGVAITGTGVTGNGSFEYQKYGETTWTEITGVSDSSALLLSVDDRIRFVPDGTTGTDSTLTFRAWDQTGGSDADIHTQVDASTNGGTTPFSTNAETISVSIAELIRDGNEIVYAPTNGEINTLTVTYDTATNELVFVDTTGNIGGVREARMVLQPGDDLIIETGNETDNITIDLTGSGFTGNLTVDGEEGFDTIFYTGTAALAADSDASFAAEAVTMRDSSLTTTGDGTITVSGTGGIAEGGGSYKGIDLVNSTLSSDSGAITLTGEGGDSGKHNTGVRVIGSSAITTSGGGSIAIDGTGGGVVSGVGVLLDGSVNVSASGIGTLDIDGTGGGTTNGDGVSMSSRVILTVENGAMTIDGTGSGTGGASQGVSIVKTTLNSTGSGNIEITGTSSGSGRSNGGVDLVTTTIDALSGGGTGSVVINGTGSSNGSRGGFGTQLLGVSVTTAAGAAIDIDGVGNGGGTGNGGVILSGSTSLTGGTITIDGTGSTTGSSNNDGVMLAKGTAIVGTGAVSITGTSGVGSGSQGVYGIKASVSGAGVLISGESLATAGKSNQGVSLISTTLSSSGTLGISGTGGVGSKSNHGVYLVGGSLTATGQLTMAGTANANTTGNGNNGVYMMRVNLSGLTGGANISGTGGGLGSGLGNYNHGIFMHKMIGSISGGSLFAGSAGFGDQSEEEEGNFFPLVP